MKRFLFGIILFVLLIALGLWALDRHTQKIFDEQVTTTKNRFLANQRSYESLIGEWRALHPDFNECGTPDPQPGFVQFASIGIKSDGSYNIARGMNFQNFRGISDASSALKVDPVIFQNFTTHMNDLSTTAMLQHQSELKFQSDTDAPIGVMFISPACPKSKYYEALANQRPYPQFTVFEKLTEDWYFFEENR